MANVRVETEELGEVVVIDVEGHIDAFLVTKIREAINELVQSGKVRLVIRFEKVSLINSTALGILVGRLRRVRMHGGDIKITGLSSEIRRIFDVMGASRIFDIHENVDTARLAFSRTMYNGETDYSGAPAGGAPAESSGRDKPEPTGSA